jgi:hypothetical protein
VGRAAEAGAHGREELTRFLREVVTHVSRSAP